jgi:hypothetical protein
MLQVEKEKYSSQFQYDNKDIVYFDMDNLLERLEKLIKSTKPAIQEILDE